MKAKVKLKVIEETKYSCRKVKSESGQIYPNEGKTKK